MRKHADSQDTHIADVRFMPAREAEHRAGASRWTLWRWEKLGLFPASIKLNGKRVWVESEVLAWMAARIAERG